MKLIGFAFALCAAPALAQAPGIATDGTVGPAQTLTGPAYSIPASLGSQVGPNLFHSFSVFNIYSGQSATFSGPGSVGNIVSRVTGGSASTIDGTLRSTIAGANFFLLNPSGVMFGPGAQLDIPGSFHVSTANYLSLADGGRFDASNPGATVLTVAPPSAFGFLGPTAATISVQGSFLRVPPGQTLSMVGGDISLNAAILQAAGGNIHLVGVASAGEVALGAQGPALSGFSQLGNVSITNVSIVDSSDYVEGPGGGNIFIRGGQIVIAGNSILDVGTYNSGAPAGRIDIAGDSLLVQGVDTWILADTWGAGPGGTIAIDVGSLDHAGLIEANTVAAGDGGSVNITASNVTVRAAGRIYTDTSGTGHGGSININTGVFDHAGFIAAGSFDAGDAGSVSITANSLLVRQAGKITGDGYATGNGGTVNITAGSREVGGTIQSYADGEA